MIEFIKANWPAPTHIRALTTLRTPGGLSEGAYHSLNLAPHVGDDPQIVAKNHQILCEALQLEHSPFWLEQVHGIDVIHWEQTLPKNHKADAILTHQKQHPCAVLTADCLPVLLCDRAGSVVAAVHAGWKGLLNGVIEATVANMQIPPEQLLAWMGPAIGPQAFEVGEEVYADFIAKDAKAKQAFTRKNARAYGDLFLLGKQRLNNVGVTAIYGGGLCTYSDPARFFSFRRDQTTGRMASLIWIM